MNTDALIESCLLLQEDELLILESLYPDQMTISTASDVIRSTSRPTTPPSKSSKILQIDLPITLPSPTSFILQSPAPNIGPSTPSPTTSPSTDIRITTSTLPTLRINFDLSPTYPIRAPPRIKSIHTLSEGKEVESYLPQTVHSGFKHKLQALWLETDPSLSLTHPSSSSSSTSSSSTSNPSGQVEGEELEVEDGQGECVLWTFLDWVSSGEFLSEESRFGGLRKEELNGSGGDSASVRGNGRKKGDNWAYILPPPPPLTPYHLLTLINQSTDLATQSLFDATTFVCGICLEGRKGRGCLRMSEGEGREGGCGDVFCLECLKDCWTLAITEGSIGNVACPGFECTKVRVKGPGGHAALEGSGPDGIGEGTAGSSSGEEVTGTSIEEVERVLGSLRMDEGRAGGGGRANGVTVEMVEKVVGKELCDRWVWLVEKKRVENDATYVRCPMAHCQSPVPSPARPTYTRPRKSNNVFHLSSKPPPSSSDKPLNDVELKRQKEQLRKEEDERARKEERSRQQDEDRWDRYRECGSCGFSFCRYCDQTWHGIHLPCPMPATQAFLQAYLSLSPHSPERAIMERRYGIKQLTKMVADWEEQEGNRKWMEENSSVCPGCSCRVEKSQGCNHMTCSKCNAHFCYRCSTALKPSDPYAHYRAPGSACFEKLFDVEEIRRFEREMAGDNAIGWEVFGGI